MNWQWDVDYMSYMELEGMIRNEGYTNIKCLWYQNSRFCFNRGFRPINCDVDVLKFIEDANVFELIDVYVEHAIGNLEMIDDAELGHDYAKEVHFNDEFAPNSDDDEVEVDRVDDDVQVGSENVEDEVQVGSQNVEDEVQVGSESIDLDYVRSADDLDSVSDTGYEHSDGIDDMDWTTLLPSDKLVDKVNNCNVDGDSDMLHTPPTSDDDEEHERFPAYKSGEASNFNQV